MRNGQGLPADDLATWDWRTALKAHSIGKFGGLAWLADTTGTKRRTVYAYSAGQRTVPITWLRKVASVLASDGSRDDDGRS